MTTGYRCSLCNRTYRIEERVFCCGCGGYLEVAGAPLLGKEAFRSRVRGIWRYREAFGLPEDAVPVSMGEGNTPVVERRFDGVSCRLKLDYMQPTGSFKDRGASVLLTLVRHLGITDICEDSSGNAGAAVSAYAAAAGVRCTVFVPAYTPTGKITQMRMYGAAVVKVPGKRQDANDAALQHAQNLFYTSHLWHPYFVMGLKSAAYELWEECGESVETLFVPVGSGGFLEGLFSGFDSLFRAGYAAKLPKLIGVQASACTPIHTAFTTHLDGYADVSVGTTVAEGIAVQRPPRAAAVLGAIRASGGYTIAVEDGEILDAARTLSESGIYVEPTSASVIAAWRKADKNDKEGAVLVLTGSGLKATDRYSGYFS
ncbi:MAG: pyridoxal-phosphate dependent enzyme [Spirochaetes bacterium]|nr:pyridoxal-phosphate dependent enzyme [Spirochaetota bacterium]